MAKGVYQRYRGSRRRVGVLIPTLVTLCILAAVVLIYVNANLEDGGDGTTLLAIPFSDEKIVFDEPQVDLIVEDPVDVVVEVKATEYEKRVEKPAFLALDENFDENLAALSGVNTVVVPYKDDSGKITPEETVKEVISKISGAKLNACAMISCFKDNSYAAANPAFACPSANGKAWTDAEGYGWLNPYHSETELYLLAVIDKAYAAGFREILLTNAHFPADEGINYNEGLAKGAAVSAFFDKIKELCEKKGDLNVAVWYDGTDSAVTGEELDTITGKFHRIYTKDSTIYNKVGNLISEDKLNRRIVMIADEAE